MNILCVSAHADDLESMAGGTVAKWIAEGHSIFGLTLTDGSWKSPEGILMRSGEESIQEEIKAAGILGYSVENLLLPAMDLAFSDALVIELLRRIEKYHIDTILCPWSGDQSHDHEIVNRIVTAASKRVPRVMMGQINYYVRDFFVPNIYVDITDYFDKKIEAMQAYHKQWERVGKDWYEYFDIVSRYYGKIIGVKRAEGFITNKLLLF